MLPIEIVKECPNQRNNSDAVRNSEAVRKSERWSHFIGQKYS
jgi:hypothetical protein